MLALGNSNKLSFGNWENYFLREIKASGITIPLSQLSNSARKKYLSEPEGDDATYKAKAYLLDAALKFDAFLKKFHKNFPELEDFSKTQTCEILEVVLSQNGQWIINLIELASCIGPIIKLVDSSNQLIGFVESVNNHVRITTEKPIQIEGLIILKSLHVGSTNHVHVNVDLHLTQHLIICASSVTIPESVEELNVGGILSILTAKLSKINPKKITNKNSKCSPYGARDSQQNTGNVKPKEPPKIGIQITTGELVNTSRIESDGSVLYISESILDPGKVCARDGFQAACLNWNDPKNSYVHTPGSLILIADTVISEGCLSANQLSAEARAARFSGMIFCAAQPFFRTKEHLVIADKSLVIVNGPAQFTSDLSAILPGSILHHPIDIAWKTIAIPPLLKNGKRFIPVLEDKEGPIFTSYKAKPSEISTQKGEVLKLRGELLLEVGNAQVHNATLLMSSTDTLKIDVIWQHSFFDHHGVFVWARQAELKESAFTNNLLHTHVSSTFEQSGNSQSRVNQLITGDFCLKPGANLKTDYLLIKADNAVEHEEKSQVSAEQIQIYCSRLLQKGFLTSPLIAIVANDLIYINGEINSNRQIYTTPVFIRIGFNTRGQTDITSIISVNLGCFIQGSLQFPTWFSLAFALFNTGITFVNLFVSGSTAVTLPMQIGLNLLSRSISAYGLGNALVQQTQRVIENPSSVNRIRVITLASRLLAFLACGTLSVYNGFRSFNSRSESTWHSPEVPEILSGIEQSAACFASQLLAGSNDNSLFAVNGGFEGFLGRTRFHLGEIDFSLLAAGSFYENSLFFIDGRMGIALIPSTSNSLISSLQGSVWVPADHYYVNTLFCELRPLLPIPISSLSLQSQWLAFNSTTYLQNSNIRTYKVVNHSNLTARNIVFSGEEFNTEANATGVFIQSTIHFKQENISGIMQRVASTDSSDAINVEDNGAAIDDGSQVKTTHIHIAPKARYDARVSSLEAKGVDNEGTMRRDYSTAEVENFNNTGTYASDESQNKLVKFTNNGKIISNHSLFTGKQFNNDGEIKGKDSLFSYDHASGLLTGNKVKVENCLFYTNTNFDELINQITLLMRTGRYNLSDLLQAKGELKAIRNYQELREQNMFNPSRHFHFIRHAATQTELDNFSKKIVHFAADSKNGLLIYKTNDPFTLADKEFFSLASFGFSAPLLTVKGAVYVSSKFILFAQHLLLQDAQLVTGGSVNLEAEKIIDVNHSAVVSQTGSVAFQTPGTANFVGSQLIANGDVDVTAGTINGIEKVEIKHEDNSRMVWRGLFSHWEESETQYALITPTIILAKNGAIRLNATIGPILLRGAQLQAKGIQVDAGGNPVLMPSAKGVEKHSVDGWGLTGYSNIEQQMESVLPTTFKAHDIYIHGSTVTGSPILEAPLGSVTIDAKFVQLIRDVLHYVYTSTQIGLLEISSPIFSHQIDPLSYVPLMQDLQQLCGADASLIALANGLNLGMDVANTANPLLQQWLSTPTTLNNFVKLQLLNFLKNSALSLFSVNLRFGVSRTQINSERLDTTNTGITAKKLLIHAEQCIEFGNAYQRKANEAEYSAPTVIDNGAQLTTTVDSVEAGIGVNVSLNGTVSPSVSVAISESKDVTTVPANSDIGHLTLTNVQTYILNGVQRGAKEVEGRPINTIRTALSSSHEENGLAISGNLTSPSGEIFHKVLITIHNNSSTLALTLPSSVNFAAWTQFTENVQRVMDIQNIPVPAPKLVKLSPLIEQKQLGSHKGKDHSQETIHQLQHAHDRFSWLRALSPISVAEAAVPEKESKLYKFQRSHSTNKANDKAHEFSKKAHQVLRERAPVYLKAVCAGVKGGIIDTLKAPLYLLDDLAFMAEINHDLRVIVYGQLLKHLFFPKMKLDDFVLYRNAHHGLAQQWSGIKTDIHYLIHASGSEKVEIISHGITTLLLPGSVLKLGRVVHNRYHFGSNSHPPLMHLKKGDEPHAATKGLELLTPEYIKTHPGLYVYAITKNGKLLITDSEPTDLVRKINFPFFSKSRTLVAHVDLTNGVPVLSAGEIRVSIDRTVADLGLNRKTGIYEVIKFNDNLAKIVFDNSSGHYRPQGKHLRRLIEHIAAKNGLTVEFNDVAKRYHGGEGPNIREVRPNLKIDRLLEFIGAVDCFHSLDHTDPNRFYLWLIYMLESDTNPDHELSSSELTKRITLAPEEKPLYKYYLMGSRSTFYKAPSNAPGNSIVERQSPYTNILTSKSLKFLP